MVGRVAKLRPEPAQDPVAASLGELNETLKPIAELASWVNDSRDCLTKHGHRFAIALKACPFVLVFLVAQGWLKPESAEALKGFFRVLFGQ
jgi:hypothetical protein